MSSKLRIPDETELLKQIAPVVTPLQATITESYQEEVAAYQKARQQKRRAVAYTVAALALLIIALMVSVIWLTLLWLGMCVLAGRAWWRYWRQIGAEHSYHHAITTATLQTVADLFGLTNFQHTFKEVATEPSIWGPVWAYFARATTEYKQTVQKQLVASELITEAYNRLTIDDVWQVDLQGTPLEFAEVSVKNVTGSGKSRRVKEIFHGYFVAHTLPTTLKGKTFVSTDGDRSGFGHQSFWSRRQPKAVEQTTLEWNEFENLLHVATNDPTEARYILTPDVMQDVYDWWVERPENIRISFIADKMYLLFPDKDMRLHTSVAKLTEAELAEYLLLLARPWLHILHITEDIRKRFR